MSLKMRYDKALVILCIFVFLISFVGHADNNLTLVALSPETATITGVDQIIKVSLVAQNAANLYGVDFDISYDPAVLTAVTQSGSAAAKLTLGSAFSTPDKFVARNQVDNASGSIKLAVTFLGKVSGITGNSELAYVYFKVNKLVATEIKIDEKMLVAINSSTGQVSEMQAGQRNAALAITGQPAPNPPVINPPVVNPVPPVSNATPSTQEPAKPISVPTASVPVFNDISNSWAKNEILKAASLNIISGDGKGKYNPKNNVTREEFAKIIFNALGLKVEQNKGTAFADENRISSWARDYVSAVSSKGLIKGDNGSFYPQKVLSRYETAVILARSLNLSEYPTGCDSFKDKTEIPTWARGYVGAAFKAGLIKGMPDGTFSGSAEVSREQAASLIVRLLDMK